MSISLISCGGNTPSSESRQATPINQETKEDTPSQEAVPATQEDTPMAQEVVPIILPPESPPLPSWDLVTSSASFSPRDTAAVFTFHDRIWLSNGYYHGNIDIRDLWNSSDGNTWERVSEQTPYDSYAQMIVYNGKIYAILDSVWASDNGADWVKILDNTPFQLTIGGSSDVGKIINHNGLMYDLGGDNTNIWKSEDGINWHLVTDSAPYGRRSNSAVVRFKDKIFLMGGWTQTPNDPPEGGYSNFTSFNDVWWSVDGKTWERVIEHAPWSPRVWHKAVVYNGKLWMLGGFSNVDAENLNDVWVTEDGINWTEMKFDKIWAPRHELSTCIFQDNLYIIAGNTWPVVNDVWKLMLSNER